LKNHSILIIYPEAPYQPLRAQREMVQEITYGAAFSSPLASGMMIL